MVGMWKKKIYWVSLPKEKPKDKFEKKIFG